MRDENCRDNAPLVLVIEDEFLVARDIAAMLEDAGFRISGPAGTVAEGLALIESEKPDLAVLDYRLRGSVVTQVADLLNLRGIPFVLATASEMDEFGVDSPFFAAENVGKPIVEASLIRALERAMNR